MRKSHGSAARAGLRRGVLTLVALAACSRSPTRRTPRGVHTTDAPARANVAPTSSRANSAPASSAAPHASVGAQAPSWCGLDGELQALTATAQDPELEATKLKRILLDPARAQELAGAAAAAAVRAIASGAYTDLAKLVDPRRGLCLRPSKGAPCRQMSVKEIALCGSSRAKEHWDADDGSNTGPSYTCHEAFSNIFFARDFLKPTAVKYNCFPELGRGNNAGTILSPPAHQAYVEYFAAEQEPTSKGDVPRAWRSLWLVFDGEPERPLLVELIAEYWGP